MRIANPWDTTPNTRMDKALRTMSCPASRKRPRNNIALGVIPAPDLTLHRARLSADRFHSDSRHHSLCRLVGFASGIRCFFHCRGGGAKSVYVSHRVRTWSVLPRACVLRRGGCTPDCRRGIFFLPWIAGHAYRECAWPNCPSRIWR
jgi:hypothetical protein